MAFKSVDYISVGNRIRGCASGVQERLLSKYSMLSVKGPDCTWRDHASVLGSKNKFNFRLSCITNF